MRRHPYVVAMTMTRRHLLTSSAALVVASSRGAGAGANGCDAALDEVFAQAGAPALAGLVLGPDGPLWMGARGVRRMGETDPITTHDRWHLGSNTKALTAALYGRLVDRGQAEWGATLSALLPDVIMDPAWRDVTIVAVMGQVAGLTDEPVMGQAWLGTARADPRSLPMQRRALFETMLGQAPSAPPGTFVYANANYVLIGAVIEQTTGRAWEEVIRAELFGPLGITTGGFGAPVGEHPWGHLEGTAIAPDDLASDNPRAMGPAGTIHLTLADYGRFLSIFLNDASGWLIPTTRAVLMQPVGSGAPQYAGGWIVVDGQPWAKGPALTHDGSNTLWYTSAWVAPSFGRAFVAVSNDGEQGGPACKDLIAALIRALPDG